MMEGDHVSTTNGEGRRPPSEFTHLLQPSPHSTDRASAENLRDLEQEQQRLLHQASATATQGSNRERSWLCFPRPQENQQEPKEPSSEYWSRLKERLPHEQRNRNICLGVSLTTVTAILVLGLALLHRRGESIFPPFHPVSNEDILDRMNIDLTAPLSLLHPTKDLGLANFVRPYESSPGWVMTHQNVNVSQAAKASKKKYRAGQDSIKKFNNNIIDRAYPTNAWYQNFLLLADAEEPQERHRVYAIPYVVDVAGPIPGIRVHPNHITASTDVVQINVVEQYGVTVGAAPDAASHSSSSSHSKDTNESKKDWTHRFQVHAMTDLGVTLGFEAYPMNSTVTKGMPYATMIYDDLSVHDDDTGTLLLPTVASDIGLKQRPIVDGFAEVDCHPGRNATKTFRVEREIEVLFLESDFTWIIFFSKPVNVRCVASDTTNGVQFQVVSKAAMNTTTSSSTGGKSLQDKDGHDIRDKEPFVIRVAIHKQCTSGTSAIWCHQEQLHPTALLVGQGDYGELLREHAHLYPGPNSHFFYEMNTTSSQIRIHFDWDVQTMSTIFGAGPYGNQTGTELLAFALPHHYYMFDKVIFAGGNQIYCAVSLIGPACLVKSSKWTMIETAPQVSFRAAQPPAPWALGELAKSLKDDLHFRLPRYFAHGAGDTYFSGKMLAKLGRILVVAKEVKDICSHETQVNSSTQADYDAACKDLSLPTDAEVDHALAVLRSSVEIWINGSAITPFVYDSAWGGVVSCGCDFENGDCLNRFPNCPAFEMPGMNFGNAWYNDCHFHYGYHVYAAAVVSQFDAAWAKEQFENVLLLVRSIANPSKDDKNFPTWRHKDWYQGHSWASGIATPVYVNGKNQESSSEAIAAYEAVALYGATMVSVWEKEKLWGKVEQAERVRRSGEVMLATELRAAHTYWHVTQSAFQGAVKIYPASYTSFVIGILWQMMAQFQTWFGRSPYLMYGIQLMPLTPISEARDNLDWAKEAYGAFSKSCEMDEECSKTGWGVEQIAMLATVGHPKEAMELTLGMPKDAFDGPAGDGHSLSNTIWWVSTRPIVEKPLPVANLPRNNTSHLPERDHPSIASGITVKDCNRPESCTDFVLDTIAGLYTCRQRIQWLMQERAWTEEDACAEIAGIENPKECGACNPYGQNDAGEQNLFSRCPACTPEQCNSEVNRCPAFEQTFVCMSGPSEGGCAGFPWRLDDGQCSECCELSSCSGGWKQSSTGSTNTTAVSRIGDLQIVEVTDCPACSKHVCRSRVNQCPASGAAPFLCYEGMSTGGCSPKPWAVKGKQCEKCCTVTPGCDK